MGFALLAVVSASMTPGTASAQPDTDRSLNADKTATTDAAATTNAAPVEVIDTSASAPPTPAVSKLRDGVNSADATSGPDLSGLTHEELEARVKNLTASLASANTESEYFREQWTELKLRDEALGVEALTV